MIPASHQTSVPSGLTKPPDVTRAEFNSKSKRVRKWVALLILLAVSVSCLLFELHFEFANTKSTPDFVGLYAAGAILRQGSGRKLYDVALQSRIERQLMPKGAFLAFDHPPFEAWLYEAFALLPLSQAYLLCAAINLILLGLIFYLARFTGYRLDHDSRLVWLIASFPIVAGVLVLGQDTLLLALIFLLAFLALKRGRDCLAGSVLGLGLFRFEIVLPFAFIFFLRRRWRVMFPFFGMCILTLLASALVTGWSGLLEYAKVLLAVGQPAANQAKWVDVTLMPSLRGFLGTILGSMMSKLSLFLIIAGGSLFLLVWAAQKFADLARPSEKVFDLEYSLAVIAALLSSYYLFLQSLTPLIVVAFLVLGYESSRHRDQGRRDHAATILLLLFALVPILGAAAHFYQFSVLFIVLMGLAVWCSQEISAARRREI